MKNTYILTLDALKSGLVSKLVDNKILEGVFILPWSVVKEIEKDLGNNSLSKERILRELNRLKGLADDEKIELEYVDDGESDTLKSIINLSKTHNAIILTASEEKSKLYRSIGAKSRLLRNLTMDLPRVMRFFDSGTMSVHLKEGVNPRAKKGKPGDWLYTDLEEKILTREDLEEMIEELFEFAKADEETFIEKIGKGVILIQMKQYRVVIATPPFSDGYEITVVKPIKKLRLDDYNLPPSLIKRFKERAEGILIAGAPGEGKTTFSQALAEFYRSLGKVVKTIESPRDLQLPPDITQYSKNYSDQTELYDIMLLSRPDFTIFDEMRTTEDFKLFIDLRLAGVGMIGVVHAAKAIDAVQRFVERLELGMIPSVLDTVIYLKGGQVAKVYEVSMAARVPYGLQREELARPVVEIRDFFTKRVEYEFYVFGRRVFVIPVGKSREIYVDEFGSPATIEEIIRHELGDIVDEMEIKMIGDKQAILFVPTWGYRQVKKALKGKARKLRKKYGIKIAIEPIITSD